MSPEKRSRTELSSDEITNETVGAGEWPIFTSQKKK